MSEWTICITAMPTEEALDVAARIADADDADCEALLHSDGPEVCDVLRCEVLHQAEVIERRTADLSTATGEIARLRAALAVATRSLEAATTGERLTTCDELARLSREVATLRAAYATDLAGLRAEVRRADDERAAWRERVEAAEREALRLRGFLPPVALVSCPACGVDITADLDDGGAYITRRHSRREPARVGAGEIVWCDGGLVRGAS